MKCSIWSLRQGVFTRDGVGGRIGGTTHAMNVRGWLSCDLSPHSSSAAVSVKDSNGTFVSTLSMILYNVSTHRILRRCHLFTGRETGSIRIPELSTPNPSQCFQNQAINAPSSNKFHEGLIWYSSQQDFPGWIHLMFSVR